MATMWVPADKILKLTRDLRKVRKRHWTIKIKRANPIGGKGYLVTVENYTDFDHIANRYKRDFGAIGRCLFTNKVINGWK